MFPNYNTKHITLGTHDNWIWRRLHFFSVIILGLTDPQRHGLHKINIT